MIEINAALLDEISDKARNAPRKRINYNFHKEMSDPLQRMINALEPGTYIRPHKHENPDKMESFVILKGSVLAVTFSEDGNIRKHTVLDPEKGVFGVEIAPREYHTIIAISPGSAVYEIKNGPYDPENDKNFAPWAPPENTLEARKYLNDILLKLNIKIS